MAISPLYQAADLKLAYQLRYSWTGWTRETTRVDSDLLEKLKPLWEQDGLRLLEHRSTAEYVQLAFSTTPDVSPVLLASRTKGRLQHALRAAGTFAEFSRMVSVRSVGENTREQVERYIASQVAHEQFVDARFREELAEFTIRCPEVDLSLPSESSHGRYWYNLHLVLVTAERCRVANRGRLAKIRDGCFRIAEKRNHAISVLSVMPDHVHLAMRGDFKASPVEIGLGFLNNLAYLLGQARAWTNGFYAGTFSEYDMGAIRTGADEE